MRKLIAKGMPHVIQHAERHRRTPRPTAISGKAMRAWVAGGASGRFNAPHRQILPILAFEPPKGMKQPLTVVTENKVRAHSARKCF